MVDDCTIESVDGHRELLRGLHDEFSATAVCVPVVIVGNLVVYKAYEGCHGEVVDVDARSGELAQSQSHVARNTYIHDVLGIGRCLDLNLADFAPCAVGFIFKFEGCLAIGAESLGPEGNCPDTTRKSVGHLHHRRCCLAHAGSLLACVGLVLLSPDAGILEVPHTAVAMVGRGVVACHLGVNDFKVLDHVIRFRYLAAGLGLVIVVAAGSGGDGRREIAGRGTVEAQVDAVFLGLDNDGCGPGRLVGRELEGSGNADRDIFRDILYVDEQLGNLAGNAGSGKELESAAVKEEFNEGLGSESCDGHD